MMIQRLPKMRVSIINKCQLKCSFCGGNDTHMENFQPQSMDENVLTYKQLIKIIKVYISLGGEYIQFTGGEPLLYNNIVKLTNDISMLGGIPEINTNGVALSEQMAERLANSGLNVIKVSIPSFQRNRYYETTGVDCFGKVLKNIENAKKYLTIRINTVAMNSHYDELDLAINTCRMLGVKQLLFLELLYYYDIKEDSKVFFKSEYVDVLKDFGPKIEEKLKGKFEPFDFYMEYENSLQRCISSEDGFEVYIKQARKTLRTEKCNICKHFCQEGIYELRLSTGGYLSFCNVVNNNGFDVSKSSSQEIEIFLNMYLKIFSSGYIENFDCFLQKHCLT